MKKINILILLIILLLTPAIHKVSDKFPPEWFHSKFDNSLINKIPYGILISYLTITILEFLGPLFFILALAYGEFKENVETKFTNWGFQISLILFTILTFGSFLIQDYENGFLDFMYFVAIALLQKLFWPSKLEI